MSAIFVTNPGDSPIYPNFVIEGTDVMLRNDTAPGCPSLCIAGPVLTGTTVDFAARNIVAPDGSQMFAEPPVIWWRLHPGVNRVTVEGGTAKLSFVPAWT